MDRESAPKGVQNSAQGFNPGNPHNKRFSFRGREMMDRGPAPQGLENSAQGFNPGNLKIRGLP